MMISVRQVNGDTYECVNGHARLQIGLDVCHKVPVQDLETGETFEVCRGEEGVIIRIRTVDDDIAETKAHAAIIQARRS